MKVTLHINRWVELYFSTCLHRKLALSRFFSSWLHAVMKTKRTADLMKVYRGTRGRAMMIEDPQELPYNTTGTSRPYIFLYTFSLSLCCRNQTVYMTTLILSEVIIANEEKNLFCYPGGQISFHDIIQLIRIGSWVYMIATILYT